MVKFHSAEGQREPNRPNLVINRVRLRLPTSRPPQEVVSLCVERLPQNETISYYTTSTSRKGDISRCRAKCHPTNIVTFRSAKGQKSK